MLFCIHQSLDEHLKPLMNGSQQLDALLALPVFVNLAHVNLSIMTSQWRNDRDEEQADDLRACSAKLDERGVLGCVFTQLCSLLSQ